jgi:dethiobiotin synthetase
MSRAKGLFITGTDTGVGKTRVTAVLAVALRQYGLRVGVMKPVETGCVEEDGQLLAQDSFFLRQISGCTALPEIVTPYMFREPLAPAIAAQHEGQEIDLDHIARCYEKLAAEHDIVLVEGAGGLLVPLTRQESFLDLATRLDFPILVVARNILGTINHTALTVTVASQCCRVIGIVLNTIAAEVQDASQTSNAEALQVWGGAPLVGQVPYVSEITVESLLKQGEGIDFAAIQALLERNQIRTIPHERWVTIELDIPMSEIYADTDIPPLDSRLDAD